jgi:hypothetical protein
MKAGRALERLVATIERALGRNTGVTVESPKFLPDRVTGEGREHDVVITFSSAHHELLVGIECRDRSRRVTVNDVEAFISKCRDTGVHKEIIVAPRGFSKSAVAKAQANGVGCLSLSQAQAFNWLLAPGFIVRNRKILTTQLTVIPDSALAEPPTLFTVLDPSGHALSAAVMTAAAHQEFSRRTEGPHPPGPRRARIVYTAPGVSLRDDSTGVVHPVRQVVAEIEYEIIDTVTPFTLVRYADSTTGAPITDVAIAEVDFGAVSGQVVIVYKEHEGGHVVFMPNRAATDA